MTIGRVEFGLRLARTALLLSHPYLTYLPQMDLWFMMPNPPETDMGRISKKEPNSCPKE